MLRFLDLEVYMGPKVAIEIPQPQYFSLNLDLLFPNKLGACIIKEHSNVDDSTHMTNLL